MVPTTVAVWADAAKLKPSISRQRTNRERTRPFFAAIKRLPAHLDEKEFIVSTPSRWQAKLPGRTWSSGNVNDADRLVPLFVRRCQENFASGASAYCMRNGLNCPISLVFAKVGAFGTWDLWHRRPGNQSAGRLWPRPPERQALSAGIDASGGRDSSVWASVIRPRQVFIMVRKRKIGAPTNPMWTALADSYGPGTNPRSFEPAEGHGISLARCFRLSCLGTSGKMIYLNYSCTLTVRYTPTRFTRSVVPYCQACPTSGLICGGIAAFGIWASF